MSIALGLLCLWRSFKKYKPQEHFHTQDQNFLSTHLLQMQGYGQSVPQQHVLVGQQYVVQGNQPTVLILKEKNISMGTDSDVTNQHGQV